MGQHLAVRRAQINLCCRSFLSLQGRIFRDASLQVRLCTYFDVQQAPQEMVVQSSLRMLQT